MCNCRSACATNSKKFIKWEKKKKYALIYNKVKREKKKSREGGEMYKGKLMFD